MVAGRDNVLYHTRFTANVTAGTVAPLSLLKGIENAEYHVFVDAELSGKLGNADGLFFVGKLFDKLYRIIDCGGEV